MKGIKGILLDLDDTFYDYSPCHESAFLACFELFKSKNLIKNLDEYKMAYKDAQSRLKANTSNQAASHNRVLYFQFILEDLNIFDPELTLSLYDTYWNTFLDNMKLFPNFTDFIKKAKENNVKIAIVTDLTAHIQNRKLIKLRLNKYIDFLISSEEAGAEKPTPIMFELALKKLGLKSNEVIFIGDNFKKDIEGAKSQSICPYWLVKEETKLVYESFYYKFSNYKDLINELF